MPGASHLHCMTHGCQVACPLNRPLSTHIPRATESNTPFHSKNPTTSSHHSKVCSKFKVGEANGEERKPLLLPVVVRRSGRDSRYVWDGARLRLVGFDRAPSEGHEFVSDGFTRLFQMSSSAIQGLFVPRHVQDNYMGYLGWKFLHRIFSSALQVLATQAMFRAIGIGSSHALPSAAALNWLLKDGLGRLSRCIYTASLGSAFDTNLKRVRFSTAILFSLSIGVELLTPTFPQYFLLLATVANIGKSVSLAAYIATGTAIHRSFAIADNLGEVSAKAQLQTVCFDNLGLTLAALLNILCRNNKRFQTGLTFVIYPIFAAVDLFSIYQALKHVHLQTLTKDRLEIIIDTWIQSGYVPSPAEVSKKEGIDFLGLKGNKSWLIKIGCVDPKTQSSTLSLLTLQYLGGEDPYFICLETARNSLTRRRQRRILLCLQERAGTSDIIMGLLQACRIRRALVDSRGKWDPSNEGFLIGEWFKLLDGSKMCAMEDFPVLWDEIRRSGWAVKNILLCSQEQIRYTVVKDG